MEATMYDYYLSQGEYLERILQTREACLGPFADLYTKHKPDRIYLIGSGTSYHACNSARDFIEALLHIEVSVLAPSMCGRLYGERPLALAVSQGGRSTNTLALISRLQGQGIPAATLSYSLETPVAQAGDCPLVLDVDNETAGPKTRGYTGTVLALYLAALGAARKSGTLDEGALASQLGGLKESISYMKENQESCAAFFLGHREALKEANHYIFTGKGPASAAGSESALKELETLCYPASAYDFEEFLHGPVCCLDPGTALFIYLSHDEDSERMIRLSRIAGGATKNVYLISYDDSLKGDKILNLKAQDPYYHAPFSAVLPGQYLSATLPEAFGRARHSAVKDIFADMDTKVPV
ncbi:MAG: SIS domain-containing protein [Treponema sp.]|nr:SIS domain-containing protein [Treponema sp.]